MARVVLFIGDSNTRGFGVLQHHRYAAVLEQSLAAALEGRWNFSVASSPSDLRIFGGKLEAALTRYQPDLLVVQCPGGPVAYFIDYPRWLNPLRRLQEWHLRWRTERAIAAEVDDDPARQRTQRDSMREGRYTDSVHRLRLVRLAWVRRLQEAARLRYGVVVKAKPERYLDAMLRLRAAARARMQGPILFLGLLPNLHPGYNQRACDWSTALAKHLPDPAQCCFYMDLMQPLAALTNAGLLLSDDMHLSVDGHRRLAGLILPELRRLIEVAESRHAAEDGSASPNAPVT